MNKNDKEWIVVKLRAVLDGLQTAKAIVDKTDKTLVSEYYKGKIDGLMEAINLVRGA